MRLPTSVNPVLRRELLERWRSRRAAMTLTIYLGVLGAGLYLLYRIGVSVLRQQVGFGGGFGMGGPGFDAALLGPILGRFLLESLLFFVLALVLFVAPGYAAAQISGERERRTLTLLQVTLLTPLQIVLGKLGASVAWLTLLVVATLPLGAAAFFLGGVGLSELLRGVVYILVIAVCVAAMAIGVSSSTKRTTGSIVLTYGLVLALTGGTAFVSVAEYVFRASRPGASQVIPMALYLNPAYGLADAVATPDMDGFFGFGFGGPALPSPLALIAQALPRTERVRNAQPFMEGEIFLEEDVAVPFDEPFPGAAFPEAFPEEVERRDREPVWLQVMGIYLCFGALGLLVAHTRLRKALPGGRRHRRPGAVGPGGEVGGELPGEPPPGAGAAVGATGPVAEVPTSPPRSEDGTT